MPLYNRKLIRNFSIIAHIDHGKSTIADRLLELTERSLLAKCKSKCSTTWTLSGSEGSRSKPILSRCTMKRRMGKTYQINFIDTPGHVDFTYEVSRSLSACEGALLVVDAVQGVQAQSLANVHLAIERNLEIVPVINKIDLPAADVEGVKKQIEDVIGLDTSDAILCSAKSGIGIKEILESILHPCPSSERARR